MSEFPPDVQADFERRFHELGLQAMLVDPDGRIIIATSLLEAQLALEPGALVLSAFDSVFSARNPRWLSRQIRKEAATGAWFGDAVFKRSDGTEWWAHIQACNAPMPDVKDGTLLMLVEDITERVEITSALMRRTEELFDRNSELEIISRIGKLLLANSDLESRLNAVVREATNSIGADVGMLYIRDRHTNKLVCRAVCGEAMPRSMLGCTSGMDEQCMAVHTVRTGETLAIRDVPSDPRTNRRLMDQIGVKSGLSVPIAVGEETFGALMVGSLRHRGFPAEDITLVEIITNYAAFAIYNTFLGEDVKVSRAYWQRTFDAIDELMVVVDPRGTVLRVNEAFARRMGARVSDLVDRGLGNLVPTIKPDFLDEIATTKQPVMLGEVMFDVDVCDTRAFPLFDGAGNVDGIVVYAKTITNERRLSDEVRRASRLASVGELLSGTAHSFGNVLMALQGAIETARHTAKKTDAASEVMSKLDRALAHVGKGIDVSRRLLSFSRGVEEEPAAVLLGEVVEAAIELCRTHPAAKQRTVTVSIPKKLPLVEARPGPLQEVVLNLVLNALQAMEPGGEVRIEAELGEDECAYLRIADNGAGMSPETARRAFEPFYSTKGGTGLGLPTSAAAIHRMGGVMTMDSRLGEGTTFTIKLNLVSVEGEDDAKAA